jgi:hypothetical protein
VDRIGTRILEAAQLPAGWRLDPLRLIDFASEDDGDSDPYRKTNCSADDSLLEECSKEGPDRGTECYANDEFHESSLDRSIVALPQWRLRCTDFSRDDKARKPQIHVRAVGNTPTHPEGRQIQLQALCYRAFDPNTR